jgi:hypothetical protein
MPTVPTYDRKVRQDVPVVSNPPAAAFGMDVYQANKGLGEAIQGLGSMLSKRALEQQEQKDLQVVTEAETAYRKDMDDLLYNQDNGILNRSLIHAENSTKDYDEAAAKIRQKYLEKLPGENQKLSFDDAATKHYMATRDQVVQHEITQVREGQLDSLKNYNTQLISDAGKNPGVDQFRKAQEQIKTRNTDVLGKMKSPQDKIDQLNQSYYGELADTMITSYLNKNDYRSAQAFLNAVKDSLHTNKANDLAKIINGYRDKIQPEETKATIQVFKNEAIVTGTTEGLAAAIQKSNDVISAAGTDQNLSPEIVKSQQEQNTNELMVSVVSDALENKQDIPLAKKYLEAGKGLISGEVASKLDTAIQKAGVIDQIGQTYSQVQNLKLSDGRPDFKRVQEYVRKNFKPAEAEQILQGVEERLREDESNLERGWHADDQRFQNAVAAIFNRSSYGGKAEALKLVSQFARDEDDKLTKKTYIDRLFDPPKEGRSGGKGANYNPMAFLDLYEKISLGEAGRKNIDDKLISGELSDSEYSRLRIKFFNESLDDGKSKISQEEKKKSAYILGQSKRFKKKEEQDAFKSYFIDATEGKSYEETVATIDAELKKPHNYWDADPRSWGEKPIWKQNYEDKMANTKEMGSYYNLFGAGGYNGRDIAVKLCQDNGHDCYSWNINQVAGQIGGSQALQKGSIQLYAIQRLYTLKKPLTVANIMAEIRHQQELKRKK